MDLISLGPPLERTTLAFALSISAEVFNVFLIFSLTLSSSIKNSIISKRLLISSMSVKGAEISLSNCLVPTAVNVISTASIRLPFLCPSKVSLISRLFLVELSILISASFFIDLGNLIGGKLPF